MHVLCFVVNVEMEIHIPEVLCAAEDLARLGVYAYDKEAGWVALRAQELDLEARAFLAQDRRPRLYAVLGPEQCRPSEVPPAPKTAEKGEDSAGIIEVAKAERPPRKKVTERGAVPPESIFHKRGKPRPDLAEKITFLDPVKRPVTGLPGETASKEYPPVTATEAPSEPSARERGMLDLSGTTLRRWQQTRGDQPEQPRPEIPTRPQPRPVPEPGMEAVLSMVWGRSLELRPSGMDGLFLLTAPRNIGARLVSSADPPVPLPSGLAAFTGFVTLETSPARGHVEVAMTLRPSPKVCAPHNLNKLALYGYNTEQGWRELPGQKFDPESGRFSAIDTGSRVYVVVGPAQHLLKKPEPSDW